MQRMEAASQGAAFFFYNLSRNPPVLLKSTLMFGIFKKKSEKEKYQKLVAEAHKLSHQDRKAGDAKLAEAEEVAKKIEAIG